MGTMACCSELNSLHCVPNPRLHPELSMTLKLKLKLKRICWKSPAMPAFPGGRPTHMCHPPRQSRPQSNLEQCALPCCARASYLNSSQNHCDLGPLFLSAVVCRRRQQQRQAHPAPQNARHDRQAGLSADLQTAELAHHLGTCRPSSISTSAPKAATSGCECTVRLHCMPALCLRNALCGTGIAERIQDMINDGVLPSSNVSCFFMMLKSLPRLQKSVHATVAVCSAALEQANGVDPCRF